MYILKPSIYEEKSKILFFREADRFSESHYKKNATHELLTGNMGFYEHFER